MHGLTDNYHALTLAIMNPKFSVDKAVRRIMPGTLNDTTQRKTSPEENEDMLALRSQGLTYREIGEIFGIKADAVYNRIRRIRERVS